MKFSPFLRPRPPEHDDRASVSSGRSDFVSSKLDELGLARRRRRRGRDLLDGAARRPWPRRRRRSLRTVTTARRALELDRGDDVAGVHRPLERAVGVDDAADVGRHAGARAARRRGAAGPCRSPSAVATTRVDALLLRDVGERRRVGVGEVVLERRAVDGDDRLHAVARRARLASASTPLPSTTAMALAAGLARRVLAGARRRPAWSSGTCRGGVPRRRGRCS